MRVQCHNCKQDVPAAGRCAHCGASFNPLAVVAHYLRVLWRGLIKELAPVCPRCSLTHPLKTAHCSQCGFEFSAGNTFAWHLRPFRRWWDSLNFHDPRVKRRVQWLYLLISVLVLYLAIRLAETRLVGSWVPAIILAVIYTAALALMFFIAVPKQTMRLVARCAAPLTKLALMLNCLALILVLQVIVGTWQQRAWILASTFLVSSAGLWIFVNYLYPFWCRLGALTYEEVPTYDFDEEQGRGVKRDTWRRL